MQRHFLSYCSHERQTGDRWMGRLKGGPTNHKRSPAETQYGCGDFSPSEKRKTRRSLWTEVVSLEFIFKVFIFMKNKRRALLTVIQSKILCYFCFRVAKMSFTSGFSEFLHNYSGLSVAQFCVVSLNFVTVCYGAVVLDPRRN